MKKYGERSINENQNEQITQTSHKKRKYGERAINETQNEQIKQTSHNNF
jgi:hypothetical protein